MNYWRDKLRMALYAESLTYADIYPTEVFRFISYWIYQMEERDSYSLKVYEVGKKS